ncbi:uncharacterized protein PRCAT00000609001 [Priceomyces carsonii]|uniref:uncharacterized protein n=1 Tax=Priceomyces carsonii TaxID=28549 RepID=UPI002EDB460B|nr:unnamed protein product [Priceomyces carsonii]
MPLEDIPLDVWYIIFIIGNLTISDGLSLRETSSQIFLQLRHNYMWHKLLRNNWTDLGVAYSWKDSLETCPFKLDVTTSFQHAVSFNRQEVKFAKGLNNCLAAGRDTVLTLIDEYGGKRETVPIIAKLLERSTYNLRKNIDKGIQVVDIMEPSLLTNLLIGENFRIGLETLKEILIHKTEIDNISSFERFWFGVSFFDHYFHRLIKSRKEKTRHIRKILYEEIYVKELIYKLTPGIKFSNDGTAQSIVFRDNTCFCRFITRVLRLSCSCFKLQEKFFEHKNCHKYFNSYFLEDFYISRIYAGEAKGHPLVLMSIFGKILDEFLSSFKIRIGPEQEEQKISLKITKYFLQVDKWYFHFQPKLVDKSLFYEVQSFGLREVVRFLRSNFNYSGRDQFNLVLRKISIEEMALYFFNLNDYFGADSMSTLFYHEKLLNKTGVGIPDYWLERDISFIKVDDYKLAASICKYLFCETLERKSEPLLQDPSLSGFLVQIHLMIICRIMDNSAKLKYYLEKKQLNLFLDFFNLKEIATSYALKEALESSLDIIGQGDGKPDTFSEMLVWHPKFDTLGVVYNLDLIKGERRSYCHVYTLAKSFEVYDVKSLTALDGLDSFTMKKIIKYFLAECGIESFGFLFFKTLANVSTNPHFLKYDSI